MPHDSVNAFSIHQTADVSPSTSIGEGTRIWHEAQVCEGVQLGRRCIVGKGVYIDFNVHIGDFVKIQNRASVYHGTTIEDGVFIGPHVVFTNDMRPRAITPEGTPKADDDWTVGETLVHYGASIGAGSVILPGLDIGRFALVGAGSIVTKDVPDHGIVIGNPARLVGYACACGDRLNIHDEQASCLACGRRYRAESTDEERLKFIPEEH